MVAPFLRAKMFDPMQAARTGGPYGLYLSGNNDCRLTTRPKRVQVLHSRDLSPIPTVNMRVRPCNNQNSYALHLLQDSQHTLLLGSHAGEIMEAPGTPWTCHFGDLWVQRSPVARMDRRQHCIGRNVGSAGDDVHLGCCRCTERLQRVCCSSIR